jgi:hypothetical protein
VADVGEELGLEAVDLLELLERVLQLAVLARELGADGDLLGDVAPFRQQEGHPPRSSRMGVSEKSMTMVLWPCSSPNTSKSQRTKRPARASAIISRTRAHLLRHRPPARLPEGLADHLLQAQAGAVEGRLVDLQHRAVHVQQARETGTSSRG